MWQLLFGWRNSWTVELSKFFSFLVNHDAAKSFSDHDISSLAIFFRMIPHRYMLFPTLNFSSLGAALIYWGVLWPFAVLHQPIGPLTWVFQCFASQAIHGTSLETQHKSMQYDVSLKDWDPKSSESTQKDILYVYMIYMFFQKNRFPLRSLFLWPISSVTCSRLGNFMWAEGNWSRRLYELPGHTSSFYFTETRDIIFTFKNQDERACTNKTTS